MPEFCISCGKPRFSGDAFCAYCGTRVCSDIDSNAAVVSAIPTALTADRPVQPLTSVAPAAACDPPPDAGVFEAGLEQDVFFAKADVYNEDFNPTTVLRCESAYLVRTATGERIDVFVPCIIGRGSKTDTQIKGIPALSRKHVKIVHDGLNYIAVDLGATNKTVVDGVELEQDGRCILHNGTTMQLGSVDFEFHVSPGFPAFT